MCCSLNGFPASYSVIFMLARGQIVFWYIIYIIYFDISVKPSHSSGGDRCPYTGLPNPRVQTKSFTRRRERLQKKRLGKAGGGGKPRQNLKTPQVSLLCCLAALAKRPSGAQAHRLEENHQQSNQQRSCVLNKAWHEKWDVTTVCYY